MQHKDEKINSLRSIECFLLDMDGTVYVSGKAIDGAAEAIMRMRKQARVLFITNNTSAARTDYVKKLCGMGIAATAEDIYTAGNATADYLNRFYRGKRVFLLGTQALKAELSEAGICVVGADEKPDLAVIGFDTDLTYRNLRAACTLIRNGVPFLATHPDLNCPVTDGYMPDVGSFLALIEASTGRKPFVICGKPYAPIADGVKRLCGLPSHRIAMVGDRLSTDMLFAKGNGFVSVLVLSGEATCESLLQSGQAVDVILPSIAHF